MSFKNLESSENSEKCTKNENNNNNEKSENISYLIQVQSWLFTHNNYFFRFHRFKKCLLYSHKISNTLIKILNKIFQKNEHIKSLA